MCAVIMRLQLCKVWICLVLCVMEIRLVVRFDRVDDL